MSLLNLIDLEREEFCRFDDYARYSKHLARKIHTLRKSKAPYERKLVLFSAERAWANAMLHKTSNDRHQITLNKLRKACKYAKHLADQETSSSPEDRLQITSYQDVLLGTLAQERGSFDLAILHHSRALLALQNQQSALMEIVETGLRFSIYQSGAEERSINLQKYALDVTKDSAQDDWRALLHEVDPKSLMEEKGEEMVTSIQWASRSAQLKNSDLASAISTAVSGRSGLSVTASPNDFDTVLAAWASGATILNTLLEKEEDQDAAQELELTKAWLSYHSSLDRITRDKALINTVPAREGVLLCDSMNKVYTQVLALPGLGSSQKSEIEVQRRETRGQRCTLLAATHGSSLEAVALINRALSYYDTSSPRRSAIVALLNQTVARYTLSSKKSMNVSSRKWFSGDVKQLGLSDPKSLRTRSVPMKPVVFDIAWNYITKEQRPRDVSQQVKAVQESTTVMELDHKGKQPANDTPKKGLFGGLFGGR